MANLKLLASVLVMLWNLLLVQFSRTLVFVSIFLIYVKIGHVM